MKKLLIYLILLFSMNTYAATNPVWVVTVPAGTDPNLFQVNLGNSKLFRRPLVLS